MRSKFLRAGMLAAGIFVWTMLIFSSQLVALTSVTEWYVNPNPGAGNDGNNCLTAGTPCATISATLVKAGQGDIIHLAPGTYIENIVFNAGATLIGSGAENTILDGGNTDRVIYNSQTTAIYSVTIQNGNERDGQGGGGIFNTGVITLGHVIAQSNTATNGGGGLRNQNGSMVLFDSQVMSNTTVGVGGGIYALNGSMVISNTFIAGNQAGGSGGGGLGSDGAGVIHVYRSRIAYNEATAYFGGGIYNNATMHLHDSTIDHNKAASAAGIMAQLRHLTMTNSTVSGNTANNNYGGIYLTSSASAYIEHSTIAYNDRLNTAGTSYNGLMLGNTATATLKSTILALNAGRNCGNDPLSAGYNVSDTYRCGFNSTGDQQGVNPQLAPLADYGDGLWLHPLFIGSPAIDSVTEACLPTDQRGITRPIDGDNNGNAACDSGSFEARSQLNAASVSLLEGSGSNREARFTVTLALTSSQAITVDFATTDGTAQASSDYTAQSGSIVFEPGEATQIITVAVQADTDDEPDETFYLDLSTTAAVDLMTRRATATIVDDDGLSSISVSGGSVVEGDSGTQDVSFIIELSPAAAQNVSVAYTTIDGSATSGDDYLSATGVVTFTTGEVSKTITIPVIGDNIDEGSAETFSLQLNNPVNGQLGTDEANGTITDDDDTAFRLNDGVFNPQIPEGNSGTKPVVFTVTLSLPASFTNTVAYKTEDGTGDIFATSGSDFIAASGVLTFTPGQALQTVTVLIKGDFNEELDEKFSMLLSNSSPAPIQYPNASFTILNDDYNNYLPLILR